MEETTLLSFLPPVLPTWEHSGKGEEYPGRIDAQGSGKVWSAPWTGELALYKKVMRQPRYTAGEIESGCRQVCHPVPEAQEQKEAD